MMMMLLFVVAIVIAAVAAVMDWRRGVIPNWLTLPPILIAPLLYYVAGGSAGLGFSLFGLFGCGLLPYILFRMEGLGGGDVKLFAALGALAGVYAGMEVLVASLVLALVQALVMLAWRGEFVPAMKRSLQMGLNMFLPASRRKTVLVTAVNQLRLGPAICAATVFVLLSR